MLFRKILIAVNDDKYALKPAELGFAIARTLGAEASLIFVVDQRLIVSNIDTGITPMDSIDMLKKEAQNTLHQLAETLGKDLEVQLFMPEGRPTTEILDQAEKGGADLIVMGTHGRSGLLQLLTGSISAYVKRHSTVPVLIVPTEDNAS